MLPPLFIYVSSENIRQDISAIPSIQKSRLGLDLGYTLELFLDIKDGSIRDALYGG